MFLKAIISIIIGYLFGCIQNPYILVKLVKKVDIRSIGSGNAGATNVSRILGFKFGVLAGFLDVLKCFLAVVLVKYLFSRDYDYMLLSGTACIIGHIFPLFLGFKGGKGVATTIGLLAAFNPVAAVAAVLIIVVITFVTNYVALGSILVYLLFPMFFYIIKAPLLSFILSILISIIGIYKHKSNLVRICTHKENGFFKR